MELLNGGGWLKPALLALFFWGLWGFLTKIGAEKVSWQMTMLLFGVFTVILVLPAGNLRIDYNIYMLASVAAGITGAVGFLYFFIALSVADYLGYRREPKIDKNPDVPDDD